MQSIEFNTKPSAKTTWKSCSETSVTWKRWLCLNEGDYWNQQLYLRLSSTLFYPIRPHTQTHSSHSFTAQKYRHLVEYAQAKSPQLNRWQNWQKNTPTKTNLKWFWCLYTKQNAISYPRIHISYIFCKIKWEAKEKGYFLSAKNNPAHDFQPNVLIKQKDKITMLKLFTETGKGVGHDRKAVCNSWSISLALTQQGYPITSQ